MKRLGDMIGNALVLGVAGGLAWGFLETGWPPGFRLAAACVCVLFGFAALQAGRVARGGE